MDVLVAWIASALGVYLLIGLLLLVPLHRRVIPKIDHQADGASWGFRIAISPGLVALWPIVLRKGRLAARGGDPHGSPERPVASLAIRRLQSLLLRIIAVALPLFLAAALYYREAPVASSKLPEISADGR